MTSSGPDTLSQALQRLKSARQNLALAAASTTAGSVFSALAMVSFISNGQYLFATGGAVLIFPLLTLAVAQTAKAVKSYRKAQRGLQETTRTPDAITGSIPPNRSRKRYRFATNATDSDPIIKRRP